MKTLLTIATFITVLFFGSSNSFSQLNGTYTVGSGGNYTNLSAAASALSAQGVNGPVIMNILTGIYTENTHLDSIPGTSMINTVTFKSQSGNPIDVNINNPSVLLINKTDNLILRDLTFSQASIQFQNECDNIKIINNIFRTNIQGEWFEYEFKLNNLLIDNNSFSGASVFIEIHPDTTITCSNIRITNNLFSNGLQASHIFRCDSLFIEKNNCLNTRDGIIIQNCKMFNISKNITPVLEIMASGEASLTSIVSNNFIIDSNFILATEFTDCINILYIYNTAISTSHFLNYGAIRCVNSSAISILNNIGIVNGTGFVLSSTNTTLLSDYNDFSKGGNPGLIFYNGISYDSLPPFISATGLDQHSNSQVVTFVSSTDLHLAGSSIGDIQLEGIPNALVTDDIDGNPRSPLHPYKGADEPDVPLPVELSSFTSSIIKNNVTLKWTTSSEINNSGFDVERSIVNGQWKKIEFVQGSGTTITPKNYEFTDRDLSPGKYNYRLKQIDYSGNFKYYNLSNEVVIGVPTEFRLSQNYPNPFNPTTKIEYDLSAEARVRIVLYDLSGREVMTLLNETKTAGYYTLNFNGSNLSSGVYFYSINATANDASFEVTKRMVLLK